ncbi:MAG: hypothetical protein JNL73_06495 [Anaerolineales bacterium]|nr:hypothetical protein [Anaerolineales bacterium]
MMGNIQGTGSMDGLGSFPRPHRSHPLTDAQKSLVQSTLADYDSETLTADDAKEILSTFREAGIRPGQELRQAIEETGFDEKQLLELARPEGGQQPPPGRGPQGSSTLDVSALQSLQTILSQYNLSDLSSDEETDLLNQLNRSGLVRSGDMIDLTA